MAFNPESVLSNNYSGALDTRSVPLPEGEYAAVAQELKAESFRTSTNGSTMMDIAWKIDHPELADTVGRTASIVRQTIFLDLTPSGDLDFSKGKNISLGRLRDALGQNTGKPWSFSDIAGGVANVRVKHRPDKDDPTILYAEVKGVSKL